MHFTEKNYNIIDLFFDSAKKNPLKTAIIYNDHKISYSEFADQVTDTANYFLAKGISKGDRVMMFVPMSIDLYRIILALFRIGAVAVFLDEWVSRKRMEECCKVAQCKVFISISTARLFSLISTEIRNIPIKLGINYKKSPAALKFPETNSADTALITFTTGSTGIPKAAKRTHGFLKEQFDALSEKFEHKEDDIDLPVLPIVLLINLGLGSTSLIVDFKAGKPKSFRPRKIIEQIKNHNVNRIVASPFFIREISKHILQKKISLPKMRKIFTGGAPVFPMEAELYYNAFPDSKIEVVYGSTEAEPISSVDVKELIKDKNNILNNGLNVGFPNSNIQVKIIKITDDVLSFNTENELKIHEVQVGKIGEIIVSGKHVLREYFNNEAALKRNKIFIDSQCWHRTGDSGYMDENGKLFLTGRCNTLIYQGEKIIAPFIYENYFLTLSGVEIGTVLEHNKKILAIIELNSEGNKEYTRKNINSLDIKITDICFLKKIPRDPRHNSKIDYNELREILK